MTDPIPNFGGFTDWRRNTGERPRSDALVDVVFKCEADEPDSWGTYKNQAGFWRWGFVSDEYDILFWRYVNPADASPEPAIFDPTTLNHDRTSEHGHPIRWCRYCERTFADPAEPCDRRVLLALVEAAEAGGVPAELVAVARRVLG